MCKYLGLPSILSNIFSGEPVDDIVLLHCMLLSMQVSCAKAWLDSGFKVNTLVGHSFGQLAALCVADSLSLEDAFRLVAGRARLIRDKWGAERGVRYSFLGGRVIQEQSRSKTGLQSTFMVLESEIPDPIIQELKCPMQVTFEFAGARVSMAHDSTYPSARAQIVLQHFWEVLRQIIRNPYRPFQSLSLTLEEEKVALLSF